MMDSFSSFTFLDKEKFRFAVRLNQRRNDIIAGRKVILHAVQTAKSTAPIEQLPLAYLSYVTQSWKDIHGSGQLGKFYQGIDNECNIAVAIKKCTSNGKNSALGLMLKEEISILSSIRHPYIVHLLGTSFDRNCTCMVLEFAAGNTLESILWASSTRKLLTPSYRLYVASCLLSAVQYLHSHKILHRSITPEHLCMRYENWYNHPHTILIGWGSAICFRNVKSTNRSKTWYDPPRSTFVDVESETVFDDVESLSNSGFQYINPPECTEGHDFDAKSEVFCLGALFIYLLSSDNVLVQKAVNCSQSELIQSADCVGGVWPEDILKDFTQVIRQCCCSNPKDRPSVDTLCDRLATLRQRNGAVDRLPVDATKRMAAQMSTPFRTVNLAFVDTPMKCVTCKYTSDCGILCKKNHFTCSRVSCLEFVARSNVGRETFPCPDQFCSEVFYLRDFYQKINDDVYSELVDVDYQSNEYLYFVDAMKRKLFGLTTVSFDANNLFSIGDNVEAEFLSKREYGENIEAIKSIARELELQENMLNVERASIENRLKRGCIRQGENDLYSRLDVIIQRQEELRQYSGGDHIIKGFPTGVLLCPPLFMLVPVNSSSVKVSCHTIYSTYRMYFLCSYDYSWVESKVITLNQPRIWLAKIAPMLKCTVLILRILHTLYNAVPCPLNVKEIISSTSFHADSLIEDIISHMERILHLLDRKLFEDLKKGLDRCYHSNDLVKFILDVRGSVADEAYGAFALQAYKTKNYGWLDCMKLVRNGLDYAWVKKENGRKWKRSSSYGIHRLLKPVSHSSSSYDGQIIYVP